jgi:2',3'-cyclic-nucleotide 2'-phosphodiesterase/3'-nucleotidase
MNKKITIYFTSDVHGHVFPTDYTNEVRKPLGLLAMNQEIHKDENTLLVDGGDILQGSPFVSYVEKNREKVHPVAKVMNAVGYDYVTIGNHDFNYGQGFLNSYLDHLDATVLCGNIYNKENPLEHEFLPYKIHTTGNGMRVGMVGMTTEFINVWEKPEHIDDLLITNAFDFAKEMCTKLKDQVDVLVGVYHAGFEKDIKTGQVYSTTTENQASKIAEELDFDLLLTGHNHMEICGMELNGTHIVQTPANLAKYAKIDIDLYNGELNISSQLIQTRLHDEVQVNEVRRSEHEFLMLGSPSNRSLSGDMIEELNELQRNVQKWLDQKVGSLDKDMLITNHMDMALEGNDVINFMNQVQLDLTGADIALAALPNEIRGLSKEVTLRDLLVTYIYPNTEVVLEVTGEILKKALEQSAKYFAWDGEKYIPGEEYIKPKAAHYNYDYFMGIEYSFDLKKELGERLASLTFKGKDVEDDDTFTLAMNNYRATGAGGYPYYKDCKVVKDIQMSVSEMMIQYFEQHPVATIDQTKYYTLI